MRKSIFGILSTAVFSLSVPAFADQNYSVAPIGSNGSTVSFDIGYTAGVHKGTASAVAGELSFDSLDQLSHAHFTVPLSSMSTGNSTRDCHMREALGLDYNLSAFPEDHVCLAGDVLPAAGPDSIVFPSIEFDFSNFASASAPLPATLVPGQIYTVQVQGRWNIHGVTRDLTLTPSGEALTLQIQRLDDGTGRLRVQGKFDVVLADFGIIVKPFKLLGPIAINVADRVKVKIDLRLNAQ